MEILTVLTFLWLSLNKPISPKRLGLDTHCIVFQQSSRQTRMWLQVYSSPVFCPLAAEAGVCRDNTAPPRMHLVGQPWKTDQSDLTTLSGDTHTEGERWT